MMDDLRAIIREVLSEELRAIRSSLILAPGPTYETVSLNNDTDLNAFAKRIIEIADNPSEKNAILTGTHRFTLGGTGSEVAPRNVPDDVTPAPHPSYAPTQSVASAPTPAPASAAPQARSAFSKGLMTERDIEALPEGVRIVTLNKNTRLTPLARDELRRLNIKIERTAA